MKICSQPCRVRGVAPSQGVIRRCLRRCLRGVGEREVSGRVIQGSAGSVDHVGVGAGGAGGLLRGATTPQRTLFEDQKRHGKDFCSAYGRAIGFVSVLAQEISSGRSRGMSATNSLTLSVYNIRTISVSLPKPFRLSRLHGMRLPSSRNASLRWPREANAREAPKSGHLQRKPMQRTPGQTAAAAGHQRPTLGRTNRRLSCVATVP